MLATTEASARTTRRALASALSVLANEGSFVFSDQTVEVETNKQKRFFSKLWKRI